MSKFTHKRILIMSPQTLSKPYWYMLLDYWVNIGDNSGLSLPFLIGAKNLIVLPTATDASCIRELLHSVVAGACLEYCVTLKYCDTIQAYILGLQTRNDVAEPYFVNVMSMPTLALIDGVFNSGQTLDEIVSLLEEKYLSLILSGKYSRQNTAFGQWAPFDADDLKLIQNSVNLRPYSLEA